jgi:hypothetical protein
MKPKYKVGDFVRFNDDQQAVTAVITSINYSRYYYTFLTHDKAYLVNTQYSYPIGRLEEETHQIYKISPSKIWKELNT